MPTKKHRLCRLMARTGAPSEVRGTRSLRLAEKVDDNQLGVRTVHDKIHCGCSTTCSPLLIGVGHRYSWLLIDGGDAVASMLQLSFALFYFTKYVCYLGFLQLSCGCICCSQMGVVMPLCQDAADHPFWKCSTGRNKTSKRNDDCMR